MTGELCGCYEGSKDINEVGSELLLSTGNEKWCLNSRILS